MKCYAEISSCPLIGKSCTSSLFLTLVSQAHIKFAIENRQLMCTHRILATKNAPRKCWKSRCNFELHCINRHQYNTLAMCNVARVCAWVGIFFPFSSFLISFYSPLRADRKLSIKCFIIIRYSLNFVQVRGFELCVCERLFARLLVSRKW